MIRTNKTDGNIIHQRGTIEMKTEWWFDNLKELLDFRDVLVMEDREIVVWLDSLYMYESTYVPFERHMIEEDEEE